MKRERFKGGCRPMPQGQKFGRGCKALAKKIKTLKEAEAGRKRGFS